MRLVLDACVLFPEVVRAALLSYARAGGFAPLWSGRILEEWARAAGRTQGSAVEIAARAEAAAMDAAFPDARVEGWEPLADPAGLPDPADAHVLAAAVAGRADGIVTFNIRDFPLRAMAARGLARLHPDGFLRAEWAPGGRLGAALERLGHGERLAPMLKKSGMPRLAKALRTDEGATR
jgi:predicted nucleic acid-binding protein